MGERLENNAKLKAFFTFVYNSEVARIKYVYLALCIFFTAILEKKKKKTVLYPSLEFYQVESEGNCPWTPLKLDENCVFD